MKKNRLLILSATAIISTLSIARAGLIVYDYSDAPETLSVTASGWNFFESDSLIFSDQGITDTGTGPRISLSAMGLFTFGRRASITLGNGFALAKEGDVVDENTPFSLFRQTLVSTDEESESDVYDEYLAFLLDADDGESFYGWAEVDTSAEITPDGRASNARISIKRLVFNNEANAPLQVGSIPEPAAVVLIMGSGVALVALRRIFKRSA